MTENTSTNETPRRVVIIGGVAGGASCATRLRRNDETARITIFERGPYISFANCGLPYHVGGVIPEREQLILATPESLADRFRIDVRTGHTVLAIDRAARTVRVRREADGAEFDEPYDSLVLSPGAAPLRPPIPGIELEGILSVRTIPDIDVIKQTIAARRATRTVVIGGGFIGLEMAENLRHLGMHTTVIEKLPQVMPPFDPEMVRPLEDHLREHGIELVLGDGVAGFEQGAPDSAHPLAVRTESGNAHPADLIILAIGVRPETALAREAGLETGPTGGIKTDRQMRTSDPHIFAVGDAAESTHALTGEPALLPLAGPANRQGRLVADVICGRDATFRGVQGTAICGVFDLAVAATGLTEKALRRAGRDDFATIHIHPKNHVTYYPGAELIHLKLCYEKPGGRVLGAQAVGRADVARKIDTLAIAIQLGATIHDLAETELCYAPQFGAAKDAINYAGMVAQNELAGLTPVTHWPDIPETTTILDVRDDDEFSEGHHPRALHIPLNQLRDRIGEIPAGNPVAVYCHGGQRGHNATRILTQHGIQATNLSGGIVTASFMGLA